MDKEMICIVCPVGCHMNVSVVNDQIMVTDNQCKRGEIYAIEEMTDPKRIVPTTVKITGTFHERLPVKTDKPIKKGLIFEVMKLLNDVEVAAPIKVGEIIVENILNTGVNIVATRTM